MVTWSDMGLLACPVGLEAILWVRGLWVSVGVCGGVCEGGAEGEAQRWSDQQVGTTVGPHLPCLSFTINVCSQTV